MAMTNEEIVRDYNAAANKSKQIKILADLNCVTPGEIRAVLAQAGVPGVKMPEKNKILRPPRDSAVCRTRVDRLELRLALFGYEGSVYTLTFDREHEPENFQDVRRAWRSFLYRMKKWRGRGFDYICLIEGRYGDHRYHIHLVLRDSDFSPAEVRHLWKFGSNVDNQPLLRNALDSYRRAAKYFNKEATDGITMCWFDAVAGEYQFSKDGKSIDVECAGWWPVPLAVEEEQE